MELSLKVRACALSERGFVRGVGGRDTITTTEKKKKEVKVTRVARARLMRDGSSETVACWSLGGQCLRSRVPGLPSRRVLVGRREGDRDRKILGRAPQLPFKRKRCAQAEV